MVNDDAGERFFNENRFSWIQISSSHQISTAKVRCAFFNAVTPDDARGKQWLWIWKTRRCVSARGSDVGAMALDLEVKACVWARGSDVGAMALDL